MGCSCACVRRRPRRGFARSRTHPSPEALLRYSSTRGHGPVSLAEALFAGPAPDGGLYLPERLAPPDLDVSGSGAPDDLATVASGVLAPYLAPDIDRPALERLLADALDFAVPSIPLDDETELLDLTLGPSGAFKDVAARVLARLLAFLASGRGPRTVLVATSGDTGGAVARAFEGLGGFRVVVLFPLEGVSPVQRRIFTAAQGNVQAIGVRGDFDDCQRIAREAFADPGLGEAHGLTSANSLNIGRLLPQMAYYHLAARRGERAGGRAPTFVVPSGNLGNLTAGVMASRAGAAAAGFVAALNANDAFARYLAGEPETHPAPTVRTLSNAMDVSRPSNLERLRALTGDDRTALARQVRTVVVNDDETRETMGAVWREHGRLIDPHTAVGLAALERARRGRHVEGPAVVLATAHPGKFPEVVRAATGQEPPEPPGMRDLAQRAERWHEAEPSLAAVTALLDRGRAAAR